MKKNPYLYIVFFAIFGIAFFAYLYDLPGFFSHLKENSIPEIKETKKVISDTLIKKEEVPLSDRDALIQGMKQSFSDDFDSLNLYTDLNGNTTCAGGGKGTWQTVYHFCSRTNPANKEAEIYTDVNFLSFLKKISKEDALKDSEYPFEIDNGILKIKANPSSELIRKNAGSWAKYTSGMLTTQFSHNQIYGYFEMRAKMPKGKGIWPAFWILPEDKTWPPEVDVMEFFGEKNDKGYGGHFKIHAASHSNKAGESCGEWHDMGVDLTEDFHTYGANVQADKITYFFDGKIYNTCKPNFETNKPFYMVVNVAVGGPGSWPGEPNSENVWPAVMEVDYIKAWH